MGCLETKIHAYRIKKVFDKEWNIITGYPTTLNGRLCLLWKGTKVKVIVIDTTSQLIHCKVEDTETTFHINMTFVYVCNTLAKRMSLLNHLKSLAKLCNEPWIILWDFNTVLSHID